MPVDRMRPQGDFEATRQPPRYGSPITHWSSVLFSYTRYNYELDETASLALGISREMNRTAVRLGFSLTLPLVGGINLATWKKVFTARFCSHGVASAVVRGCTFRGVRFCHVDRVVEVSQPVSIGDADSGRSAAGARRVCPVHGDL